MKGALPGAQAAGSSTGRGPAGPSGAAGSVPGVAGQDSPEGSSLCSWFQSDSWLDSQGPVVIPKSGSFFPSFGALPQGWDH